MKKRIILSICSLCLVVCACFGFSACKKKNTNLVFGANYKFSTISLMGFTGDRNSISEYLEDQQSIEDNNFIKNYFDLVKNLEVKFNENGTGSIILTNNPGFPSLDDVVDENGNANFSFTYTKDADTNAFKEQQNKPTNKTVTQVKPINAEQIKLISEAQRKRLYAIANGNNEVAKKVLARYGYDSSEKIRVQDYEQICTEIESEILM